MTSIDIRHGDCLEVLRSLEDNSVDSVVTDPPYGLSNTKPAQVADVLAAWVTGDTEAVPATGKGFMGKTWDGFVPPPAVWAECLRVLKPGGHMAVFAGARTQDLMGLSIRLAGFEIRDTLGWIYGSGFPKSMDVSKAIDKAAGAEREVVATERSPFRMSDPKIGNVYESTQSGDTRKVDGDGYIIRELSAPATDAAKQWSGWGTALKPAIEPIILARKPLDGTVAANVLSHGVGGLNIDACRVITSEDTRRNAAGGENGLNGESTFKIRERRAEDQVMHAGRFPANVLLDEHAAAEMDEQSGVSVSRKIDGSKARPKVDTVAYGNYGTCPTIRGHEDSGGASRFFPVFKYQAKAPKKERPVIVREDGTKIAHPTVKPVALMEWLVTLITPEGGTTLDPFAGTGTTLQAARDKGFAAIGVEQDADYIALIEQRLSA
ncbi:DNA-methyltransferase [Corynebacterium variabile]|uniref:DNA-methyltransferase n=1 Tax=Corynebacterium variabile TaxID=1727 RepID=UPI0028A1FBD6|nr:DNA methyltransferase [Corynebacterium variabile]